MTNFPQIGQMVWISIGYEYIYFVLYILDAVASFCYEMAT
jgi:hypothetical protein